MHLVRPDPHSQRHRITLRLVEPVRLDLAEADADDLIRPPPSMCRKSAQQVPGLPDVLLIIRELEHIDPTGIRRIHRERDRIVDLP